MTSRPPARLVAPGSLIRRELEARGWAQEDLAGLLGRSEQAISELVRGERCITPVTARGLARAFGTSAELWLNLEATYRRHLAEQERDEKDVTCRDPHRSPTPKEAR